MVNFGLLTAEICWRAWGTPANFNGFRILAALLHGTLVVGVSQTLLRHWTEGATYIRQGGHHVGHWPTFLVMNVHSWNKSTHSSFYIVEVLEKRKHGDHVVSVPHSCRRCYSNSCRRHDNRPPSPRCTRRLQSLMLWAGRLPSPARTAPFSHTHRTRLVSPTGNYRILLLKLHANFRPQFHTSKLSTYVIIN